METIRQRLKLKQRRCEVRESKHAGQLKRQGNAGVAGECLWGEREAGEWVAGECWWGEREAGEWEAGECWWGEES